MREAIAFVVIGAGVTAMSYLRNQEQHKTEVIHPSSKATHKSTVPVGLELLLMRSAPAFNTNELKQAHSLKIEEHTVSEDEITLQTPTNLTARDVNTPPLHDIMESHSRVVSKVEVASTASSTAASAISSGEAGDASDTEAKEPGSDKASVASDTEVKKPDCDKAPGRSSQFIRKLCQSNPFDRTSQKFPIHNIATLAENYALRKFTDSTQRDPALAEIKQLKEDLKEASDIHSLPGIIERLSKLSERHKIIGIAAFCSQAQATLKKKLDSLDTGSSSSLSM